LLLAEEPLHLSLGILTRIPSGITINNVCAILQACHREKLDSVGLRTREVGRRLEARPNTHSACASGRNTPSHPWWEAWAIAVGADRAHVDQFRRNIDLHLSPGK
jgi:hypothetical protein